MSQETNQSKMDIEEELKNIVKNKSGNKEMAIFYDGEYWNFSLGNPSNWVNLGEVPGEIETSGNTLEEAIINMKQKIQK